MSDDLTAAITGGLESVTKKWAKQRRAEERSANATLRRRQAMTYYRPVTIKEAAYNVMEEAYLKASAGGTLPANARQIMYAARPRILEITGNQQLDDAYFTQTLLPDYIVEFGVEDEWDVVYDARGHLTEPHQDRKCASTPTAALGTLGVRTYTGARPDHPLEISHLPMDYPTAGPADRYSAVLFLEKEGFDQLVRRAQIADRYDLAIMSTKGMSNVAARALVDHLAGEGVRLFVARDFDIAGFSIAGTLTGNNRRYRFRNTVDAVDLGLRLGDVDEYELESEEWSSRSNRWRVEQTLRRHGADDQEANYLVRGGGGQSSWGHRVELNALASDQFVQWLESKLDEYEVEKVIPAQPTLEQQYRRSLARIEVNRRIDEVRQQVLTDAGQAAIPDGLAGRVRELLDEDDTLSWDDAVTQIAEDPGGGDR